MAPEGLIPLVITALLLTAGAWLRPDHARCPHGWWLPEGIRRNGAYACRPEIVGSQDDVFTGIITSVQPEGVLGGVVFCRAGEPITFNDFRGVGCSRK